MIKERTEVVKDVLCDLCGQDTGYDSEQSYVTDRERHFCREHKKVGDLFEELLDMDCRKSAVFFYNEYKEVKIDHKEK